MNNTLLYIFCFISLVGFAQTRDTIPYSDISKSYLQKENELYLKAANEQGIQPFIKNDTLYILLRKRDKNKILISQTTSRLNDTITYYRFLLKDSTTVGFYHKKYFDFDLMQAKKQSKKLLLDKEFLERNKNKILTYDFFIDNKDKETAYFLRMLYRVVKGENNTIKKIFIIDNSSGDKPKELIAKEIKFDFNSHKFFLQTE